MVRKRSKAAEGAVAVSEDVLATDVAAYAAEIGLAPQDGGGRGFDDSDFRPEVANVKIGEDVEDTVPSTEVSKKKSKNKFKRDEELEEPARPPAEVLERTWNVGAGARPGGKSGKSLLGEEDSSVWYEAAATLPAPAQADAQQTDDVIEVKTKVAERLMESETNAFSKKLSRSNNADFQWLQTVRSSGTSRDKIAANALVVEQNALANLHALDDLIALASKRGGAQGAAGHAVDVLKELFTTVLLPDRRLVTFETRPLASMKPSKASDRQLLFWWMEDCIKRRYGMFMKSLEDMATGSLDWAKEKALKAAAELLAAKPEGEARLLALIVNKLGDPSRRVASNAGYLISRLLTQHPLMSMVVVREVETFLFRPNQKARARYYAVVTLNQMVLSHHPQHGSPVAMKLIDIYFTLFQLVLDGKLGFLAERAAAAAADDDRATANDDNDADAHDHGRGGGGAKGGAKGKKGRGDRTRDRRGHHGGKPRRGPKPGKEVKAAPTAEEVDARLLGALLTGVRRAHPYIEIGALDGVFQKHADQVFRTVHVAPLTVSAQALMLLFQVMNSQAASSDRFYATLYAVLLRPGLERSSSLSMIFGLLFQAMKADTSNKRVAAFIKRLLQVAIGSPANVACGALFTVSEVLKAKASLWAAITQPEDHAEESMHDAEEDPAHDTPEPYPGQPERPEQRTGAEEREGAGGVLQGRIGTAQEGRGVDAQVWPKEGDYSMKKRAPQYAGAERACCWELSVLSRHVHPSVAMMARTLLAGTSILYNGDPLADLTVLAFLEKFVKRRAKKSIKGASVMQPVAALDALDDPTAVAPTAPTGRQPRDPGSAAFAALAEADVAAEDVFFHRYFTMDRVKQRRAAAARTRALKRKSKKSGSGSEGESDDDGAAGAEDDSAAEDDFLDDLEQLPDDVLGDPDVGMDMHEALADALDAEAEGGSGDGSDSDAQPSDSDADILSEGSDEVELIPDAELDALDVFSLPAPSDVDSDVTGEDGHEEDGTGVESDGHGGESSSFDEETFAKGMVGHSSADDDAAVATEVELGATKSKMDKKGRKGPAVAAPLPDPPLPPRSHPAKQPNQRSTAPARLMASGFEELNVPDNGMIHAQRVSGYVDRYVRPRRGEATPYMTEEERWAVTLSGHKKGSNPRVKLDHGRLWCLRLPEGHAVVHYGENIDVFARPTGLPQCYRLQKYKRQPTPNTIIFSLTDGSDKCHLRPALDQPSFNFVFALTTSASSQKQWFVTTEAIHLHREVSTTSQKRKALRREKPDGADEPVAHLEMPTMHTSQIDIDALLAGPPPPAPIPSMVTMQAPWFKTEPAYPPAPMPALPEELLQQYLPDDMMGPSFQLDNYIFPTPTMQPMFFPGAPAMDAHFEDEWPSGFFEDSGFAPMQQ